MIKGLAQRRTDASSPRGYHFEIEARWDMVSLLSSINLMTIRKEIIMSPAKRYANKQAKARQRRRLNAQQRLDRDRRQAQQAAEALHQALEELGLPGTLVSEIEGRLQSQQKLLSKIAGVMFPALFGCRTPSELCRVRGWDKNWPS